MTRIVDITFKGVDLTVTGDYEPQTHEDYDTPGFSAVFEISKVEIIAIGHWNGIPAKAMVDATELLEIYSDEIEEAALKEL